jgi:hypothetical protein
VPEALGNLGESKDGLKSKVKNGYRKVTIFLAHSSDDIKFEI